MKYLALLPLVAVLIFCFSVPVSFANSNRVNSDVWNPKIIAGPLVVCTGTPTPGFPACENFCDLVGQVANVVYFFIGVVIWIISPIMFAWAGISLVLSRGSTEGTSAARHRITRVAIGLLIVLCAYLILYTFVSVLNIAGVGGFNNSACIVQ